MNWPCPICRSPRTTAAVSLDGVSFTVPLDEHVAIVGQGGSGKNELALLLARLVQPTGGRITIGGKDIATLPAAVIGRRIGFAGATPYLFAGTLRDNLVFGLNHVPVRPANYEGAVAKRRARQLYEARQSGNIDFDLHADWLDYRAAGVADCEALSTPPCRGARPSRPRRDGLLARPEMARRSGCASGSGQSIAGSAQSARPPARRGRDHQSCRDLRSRSGSTTTPRWRRTCCSGPRSGPLSISKPSPTTPTFWKS